jgi:hypothetical protein
VDFVGKQFRVGMSSSPSSLVAESARLGVPCGGGGGHVLAACRRAAHERVGQGGGGDVDS